MRRPVHPCVWSLTNNYRLGDGTPSEGEHYEVLCLVTGEEFGWSWMRSEPENADFHLATADFYCRGKHCRPGRHRLA